MARQLITRIWCDVCMEHDEEVEGNELAPITIGNARSRVPALCETHEKEFYTPFLEILQLAAYTDALNSTPKRPGSKSVGSPGLTSARKPPLHADNLENGIACPYEGCMSVLKNKPSLTSHFRAQHEVSLMKYMGEAELYDVQGNLIPFGPGKWGPPADDSRLVAECLITGCGATFEYGVNTNRPGQALGVHYTHAHGITATMHRELGDNVKKLNAAATK